MFPEFFCNHICNKDKFVFFSNHLCLLNNSTRRGKCCHWNLNLTVQNRDDKMCARLKSLTNGTIEVWEEFKYFTFNYDLEAGSH